MFHEKQLMMRSKQTPAETSPPCKQKQPHKSTLGTVHEVMQGELYS